MKTTKNNNKKEKEIKNEKESKQEKHIKTDSEDKQHIVTTNNNKSLRGTKTIDLATTDVNNKHNKHMKSEAKKVINSINDNSALNEEDMKNVKSISTGKDNDNEIDTIPTRSTNVKDKHDILHKTAPYPMKSWENPKSMVSRLLPTPSKFPLNVVSNHISYRHHTYSHGRSRRLESVWGMLGSPVRGGGNL